MEMLPPLAAVSLLLSLMVFNGKCRWAGATNASYGAAKPQLALPENDGDLDLGWILSSYEAPVLWIRGCWRGSAAVSWLRLLDTDTSSVRRTLSSSRSHQSDSGDSPPPPGYNSAGSRFSKAISDAPVLFWFRQHSWNLFLTFVNSDGA